MNPYAGMNEHNFNLIKEILLESMAHAPPLPPASIAQKIADKTGMSAELARQLVQEELIGAMNWLKSGDNI